MLPLSGAIREDDYPGRVGSVPEVFQVHIADAPGASMILRQVRRAEVLSFSRTYPS